MTPDKEIIEQHIAEATDLLEKQADLLEEQLATTKAQYARIVELEGALRPFAIFAVSAKANHARCVVAKRVPVCGTWVPTPDGSFAITDHMEPAFMQALETFGEAQAQVLVDEAGARIAQAQKDEEVAAGVHVQN